MHYDTLESLFTPCLLLDEARLETNIARVADHAARLDVTLRPHFKTPKCLEVAEKLLQRNATGLTVSTLREAQVCLDAGFTDLFYAVELAPAKMGAVVDLIRRGANLSCLIDSHRAVDMVSDRAGSMVIPLLVALDTDGYRCGVDANSEEILHICRRIVQADNLLFRGLMAYAGASYHCDTPAAKSDVMRQQLSAALVVGDRLDVECPVISLGSTPAFMSSTELPGATEVRGGIYTFQDLFQAGRGHCSISDIALSVLTRVISIQPERNRFFVDAGGLALSKDRATAGQDFDAGYGLVCDTQSANPIGDWIVSEVHQEHGIVTSRSGAALDFAEIVLDGLYRILPNHSDMTAAAYDEYHVIDSEARVIDCWWRFNGWAPSV